MNQFYQFNANHWIVYLNYPHRLVLPMLYVSMFHIPRLSGILNSWNIFVVNLGIKFVPQVLIHFFIAIVSLTLFPKFFVWNCLINLLNKSLEGNMFYIHTVQFSMILLFFDIRMYYCWVNIYVYDLYMIFYLHKRAFRVT